MILRLRFVSRFSVLTSGEMFSTMMFRSAL
jgi:hypothetical protein